MIFNLLASVTETLCTHNTHQMQMAPREHNTKAITFQGNKEARS